MLATTESFLDGQDMAISRSFVNMHRKPQEIAACVVCHWSLERMT